MSPKSLSCMSDFDDLPINSISPEYKGNSIVNLMSNLLSHFGGQPKYPSLSCLHPSDLNNASNIVLIVVDGLGYNYLKTYGRHSLLHKHLRGKITSVFPSSTASAMTSFYTGLAPLNHAVPGWYTYLKELGVVSKILLLSSRAFKNSITSEKVSPHALFQCQSIFNILKAKSYFILPNGINDSQFSTFFGGKSTRLGYNDVQDFFDKLLYGLKLEKKQNFVFGYWPQLDYDSHLEGTKSTVQDFQAFNTGLEKLLDSLESKNLQDTTKILITADHGLVDSPPERKVHLRDHPKLQSTLTLPLCGDHRAVFLYVRPSKVIDFEQYIKNHLNHAGTLMKTETLISRGYFGLYDPHPRFYDRIGDYAMIMKENYAFMDHLLGEDTKGLAAEHGGLNEDEMNVPLILI
ncbi:MAG: alkaline phosphatase family protein [Candidatus Hodarchaeota archaeon]